MATRTGRGDIGWRLMGAPASAGCSPTGTAPEDTSSSPTTGRGWCAGSKTFRSGKRYSRRPRAGAVGTAVARPVLNSPKGPAMAKTRSKTTNAIDLLKEDHAKVKKAFKEFESMDRSDT